jgi:hypothetical protein
MRRKVLAVLLAAVTVVAIAAYARASHPVVRTGADYDGYANPNGCSIFVHKGSTELHVGCSKADGKARIRYRFTRASGFPGAFAPASVDVDWIVHGGDCDKRVRWMVPTPRTLRVVVDDCYVHIRSVSWVQPPGVA